MLLVSAARLSYPQDPLALRPCLTASLLLSIKLHFPLSIYCQKGKSKLVTHTKSVCHQLLLWASAINICPALVLLAYAITITTGVGAS